MVLFIPLAYRAKLHQQSTKNAAPVFRGGVFLITGGIPACPLAIHLMQPSAARPSYPSASAKPSRDRTESVEPTSFPASCRRQSRAEWPFRAISRYGRSIVRKVPFGLLQALLPLRKPKHLRGQAEFADNFTRMRWIVHHNKLLVIVEVIDQNDVVPFKLKDHPPVATNVYGPKEAVTSP